MTDSNHFSAVGSIGILGAGRIGRALAQLLAASGREVLLGSRRAGDAGDGTVPLADAAAPDVVVLALPHAAIEGSLELFATIAPGTVVIDVANAVRVEDGRCRSALAVPHGRWLAGVLPHVRVVRAFTHVQDELLVSRATRQPGAWGIAVAADDAEAGEVTAELVRAAGYVPVQVGGLDGSAVLDAGGPLFLRMLLPGDLRDVVAEWRRAGRG